MSGTNRGIILATKSCVIFFFLILFCPY